MPGDGSQEQAAIFSQLYYVLGLVYTTTFFNKTMIFLGNSARRLEENGWLQHNLAKTGSRALGDFVLM